MRRRLRENPEIPTSSMADVAMLLVAFFALTAVFAQTAGLPARFDAAPEAPPENAQAFAIELRIDADGNARLAGAPLDGRDLEQPLTAALTPLLAISPERPVFVSTHPEAHLGAFVELQDALARASRRLAADPALAVDRLRVVVPTLTEEARLRPGRR